MVKPAIVTSISGTRMGWKVAWPLLTAVTAGVAALFALRRLS